MRDELLLYYERELSFMRQMGAEFAQKYPKIAGRLLLDVDKCEDPHVERMVEAFAFMAARVHLKIDDEFPEITSALLNILYPHYLRPVPSSCIVEMHLDADKGGITAPQHIVKGSPLKSRPVNGVPCEFQTSYETTVWPVTVTEAEWKTPDRLTPPVKLNEAIGAFRLELRAPQGVQFSKLNMKSIRFHIAAEPTLANTIYELLFCNCVQILVRDPSVNSRVQPTILRPEDHLRPVGFDTAEAMLPYPRRSFEGYRLLQEYFALPEKFLFFDLSGVDLAWMKGIKERAEILFLISPFEHFDRRQNLELGVNAKTFRMNCTPAINLFPQTAEPILLDQRKFEYFVIPDVRRPMATEVFSIEDVISTDTNTNEVLRFHPFYSYRHGTVKDSNETFWLAHRHRSARKNDEGTDVSLSMVDLSTRPVRPDVDVLTVRTLCTNRDLPARLPFGSEFGDFELEGSAAVKRIVALGKPTNAVRPPMGKGAYWRLMSHLTLNYLSLTEDPRRTQQPAEAASQQHNPPPPAESFREMLKLYNYAGTAFTEKQISGILKMQGSRQFARVFSENGIAFVRGTRVEMELDEDQFVGGGALLFSMVIERFLALYSSMNSFTQLQVRTRQRKEPLKEWPPRAGQKILL
ncbi:MAG: type VI secretion system baseplate subunit TssF [Acidobacteria bacterium]|nr:type VI secretion system baseplate subunit TssF [Acidobacteriota bacterium]